MKKFECKFSVLGKDFRMEVPANSAWEAWEKTREHIVRNIAKAEINEIAPKTKSFEGDEFLKDFFGGIFNDKK